MTAALKKNFTDGPIFLRMLTFALPLMASGILQILYNAADKMIVGQFSGDTTALAAIGCTGTANALIINLLIGVSGGAGVLVAQHYGAGREDEVRRTVRTSMLFSLIGGIAFMLIGIAAAEPLMRFVAKDELVEKATLYVVITCFGVPAASVYNFGSSILRAKGDSRTPLIIGIVAGLLNVGLNFVFVACLGMTVDGVAVATVISQYFSAIVVVCLLVRDREECYGLNLRDLKIEKRYLASVLMIGIPAGIQGSLINIANLVCNAKFYDVFSVEAISASAVAGSIDMVIYTCMACFSQAVTTFVGQNYGASRMGRVRKTLLYGLIQVISVGIAMGLILYLLGPSLASLFISQSDPARDEVLAIVRQDWFEFMCWLYFIHGVAGVLMGFVRGLGYSVSPTVSALIGDAGVKVIWTWLIFPIFIESVRWYNTGHVVGWASNAVILSVITFIALKRLRRIERGKCEGGDGVAVAAECESGTAHRAS